MIFRITPYENHTYTTTGSSSFSNSVGSGLFLFLASFILAFFILYFALVSLLLRLSAFLYTCRRPVGLLLLCLGIVYGIVLMAAENLHASGMKNRDYADLDGARRLYPYLRYIAQGPARSGSYPDLVRAVREDPRAFDLAAALKQLQLMERKK